MSRPSLRFTICSRALPSKKWWRAGLATLAALAACLLLPMAQAGSWDRFFQAVKVDNDLEVRSLLQRGLDPNLIEGDRGDSGLILALRENSMQVVKVLLQSPQIDLEQKSHNGDNALMIAAFKANLEAVKLLLDKGAQVNRPGWTALHYGAAAGDLAIIDLLLAKKANPDALSPNHTTPLMMAARGGHILAIKRLLDAGANPTLKNQQGYDAIGMAALHNHQEIIEGLQYRIKKWHETHLAP